MLQRVTRRRFGAVALVAVSVIAPGCLDDEDEFEPSPKPIDLLLAFETEAGDLVSDGIEVTLEHESGEYRVSAGSGDIAEGQYAPNLTRPGEYTVIVRSLDADDAFEEANETVTLPEADDDEEDPVEVTIVLEGALSDAERDDDGEDGDDEDGDGEENGADTAGEPGETGGTGETA